MNILGENYSTIKKEIADIDEQCTLIAVSKYQSNHKILDVYHAGCRDFGENKVQELVDKQESLPKDIRWHMIGHLQTNKVKYIVDKVALIHSVDSVKLAKEIQKEAAKKNVVVEVLIEVNVAREESKFGFLEEELFTALREMAKYPNVSVKGLMTIAPVVENEDDNCKYFIKLKQLSVDIMKEKIDNITMDVLSMGMSGDYVPAAREGATFVRVGTKIFGSRDERKGEFE